ncbi:MAG: leucine-rich repeat domain-containing protein [Verrucomicrobia bacterium]|nr:leucine-rich repeat domain-containing protein [Verrucomicrobiota bacterium]
MASGLNWDSLPNELIVSVLEHHVEPRFREIDSRINHLIISFIYPDILKALYNELDQNPLRDSVSDKQIYALLSPLTAENAEAMQTSDADLQVEEKTDHMDLADKNSFEERVRDPAFVISRIESVFKELMHRSEAIADPKVRMNCQETLKGLHCSLALQAMSHFENQSLISFVNVLSDRLGGAFKARACNILDNSKNDPNRTELVAHQFRQLLQEFLPELDQIEQLDLSRCKLASLPPEIGMLRELVILDLDHNKLTRLPHEIGELKKLVRLTLSNNQINQLPEEIGKLGQLSELYLDSNKLEKIPLGVLALERLETLNVNSNQVNELPEAISEMKVLKELHVANNKIPVLPSSIGDLVHLEKIDARNNCIEELPNTFLNLKDLEALNLMKNRFFKYPCFVRALPHLTELKLDTSLSSVSRAVSSSVKSSKKMNSINR